MNDLQMTCQMNRNIRSHTIGHCVTSEGSDQPVHLRSLMRILTGRTLDNKYSDQTAQMCVVGRTC